MNRSTQQRGATLVEMVTTAGAAVLGLDDRVGRLAEGLEADLICLSMDGAHATPSYEPLAHVAYAARSSDVRHVIVAGRVLVRDRELLTLDIDRIRSEAREVAAKIRAT